ncbi:MAG: ribosome biogenesis GTPase Der [Puniceicoccales bacterium]|jgi:GTP-binding protein|nr:ribosome biogenesis GTPase Der [Puniceicoccales bacterium]
MNLSYSIAIVGRPNVGKSRLFNRLTRRRLSIVHDTPGVTRDILTHEIGENVVLMDTGGFGLSGENSVAELTAAVEEQVMLAIAVADLIFFVLDAKEGISPVDYDIANMLRKSSAKIIPIANKIDSRENAYLADSFHSFGFGNPIIASAEHGVGEEEIRRLIANETKEFSAQLKSEKTSNDPIKLVFVGRPNVGKSSLVNSLFGKNRMIVSDISGTTREAVAVKLQVDGAKSFELIDSAGLRAQNRISTSLDYFSSLRTRDSIDNSHVVFLVVDAESGISKLDKKIASDIIDAGKGIIVVVNKWDIAQKSWKCGNLENFKSMEDFRRSFLAAVGKELLALPDVDVIFASAKTKHGMEDLLPLAEKLYERMNAKIGTGELNRVIQKAFEKHPPSTASGNSFKIYYAVQTGNMPFTFKLFCNRTSLLSSNYKKYLLNAVRRNFRMEGCPIRLEFVEKSKSSAV